MSESSPVRDALIALGSATLATLRTFEQLARYLQPGTRDRVVERLEPLRARLSEARSELPRIETPAGLAPLVRQLDLAAELAESALERFCEVPAPGQEAFPVLSALRLCCRAQEALYPLRRALLPAGRFFVEPGLHDALESLDEEPPPGVRVGIQQRETSSDGRGGHVLYVPERYTRDRPWPLVVALHGGFGHGRDFVWTWLREARGRGFLLLCPTSLGATWSMQPPDRDAAAVQAAVSQACEAYRVDRARILLTGLSDGATYALLLGLGEGSPFTALAPVAGVLHPLNFRTGNLERAKGRRIYLVHGTLDWMFPVALARLAAETLEGAGADLTYRELPDLAHAYPREENDPILRWFDPSLALPAR